MQQSRSSIFLAIVAALTGLSIWGYMATDYALGLDVKGGVRLTYELDDSTLDTEERSLEQAQLDLVNIMESRAATGLGVVEATVAPKGTDQIIVELPGFTDLDLARETLGSTARIIVYHARNVTTPYRERPYSSGGDEAGDDGAPYETFTRTGSDDVLRPGDEGYARMLEGWEVILEGADVVDASVLIQPDGRYQPEFRFSSAGADAMRKFTSKYKTRPENMAFVLDGRVLSISPVKENTVLSDSAYIDGDFEPSYVKALTDLIKAGSLPVDLDLLSSQKVDPTIGSKALEQIVFAGLISFALICVFLIIYYAFPGIIAALAMALYAVFTITALKLMGATFSLAAIAALILSVGMAVDANVLVFERIKEELRAGKKLMRAVDLGFKHALSAIVDSNAATIITSLVLAYFGTGPVKGFATALIIGVAISFLTAFAITRSLMVGAVGLGLGTNPKWYALNRNWFGEKLEQGADGKPINIVGNYKKYFLLSGAFIAIGMIFVGIGGIKPNVEFQGGFEGIYNVPNAEADVASIRGELSQNGFSKANVKLGESETGRIAYVTVPYGEGVTANDPNAVNQIAEAAGLPAENASFQEIGPTIQQETVYNAIMGVTISALLIVLYLAIRFGFALGGFKNGIKFGMSAIGALMHDVLVVIGTAGIVGFLFGWEISALFITAMLTVIGFSVHDTIVIFDRIRENLRAPHKGQTFEHLVNKSITQSVARSINTSFTAILPLGILIAIGTPTPELKFMCVAMLAGIAVGTYSSIFNAAPILWLWNRATIKSKGEDAGMMQEAAREQKLIAQQRLADKQIQESSYGTIKRRNKTVADKANRNLDEDQEDED